MSKLNWPSTCESCPLRPSECKAFARLTSCNESPCDVYSTYTDYINAEEDN